MALTIGKLTILLGAGVLGSAFYKEGSGFSDILSSVFKSALKPIRQIDTTSSGSKPKNDALMAQVNSLRQELQILASSRPVTIVTSSTAGSRRYGVVIMIVVFGFGYAWWKGWRLPDLSFATKRSLSDATASISKQLEDVYLSISTTKRNLSSRINQVDSSITEVAEQNDRINREVTQLCGTTGSLDVDIKSFHEAVQTLETKIHTLHGNEEETNGMVFELLGTVLSLETRRQAELQASPSSTSRPALERAQSTPTSIGYTPSVLSLEPPSPSTCSSSVSDEVQQPLETVVTTVGLKDLELMWESTRIPEGPRITNRNLVSGDLTKSSSLGSNGWRMISGITSILSRTRSAS